MRTVIQRVTQAQVAVDGTPHAAIGPGLMVLVCFQESDTQDDVAWMVRKVTQLRIFDDQDGVMNRSVMDLQGALLVVSQFTLYASTRKGNRPSYIKAALPVIAIPLYESFCQQLREVSGLTVETGVFGANMQVSLVNDGPVTILIDTNLKE